MRIAKGVLFAASLCLAGALAASQASAGPPPGCTLPKVTATLTAPSITCAGSTGSQITLRICGTGTYGAPAGFTVQMKSKADFDADYAANPGAPCDNRGWGSTGLFGWSLSGQCNQGPGGQSPWNLSSGECVNLVIDQDFLIRYADAPGVMCGASGSTPILTCGTEYVFRIFAHNLTDNQSCPKLDYAKSDWGPVNAGPPCSTGLVCATADCPIDGGCTYSWGYWKTHGPIDACNPGNQVNDWDVTSLTIGGQVLNVDALCAILHDAPNSCEKGSGASAVLILEHQLIGAMLNMANGAIPCPAAKNAIVAANALLVGNVYGCVGTNSILGQQMLAQANILAAYNSDICDCSSALPSSNSAIPVPSTVTKASWGQVKSIYR